MSDLLDENPNNSSTEQNYGGGNPVSPNNMNPGVGYQAGMEPVSKKRNPIQRMLPHNKFGVALVLVGVVVSAAAVTVFYNREASFLQFGSDYKASEDAADEVLRKEEAGYSYAFGTEPSDDRDFSQYSLPKPDQTLEDKFYEALNTSPAFEHIDNVNEIIEYDQFDKDGNISEEAMREIISIAEGSAQ